METINELIFVGGFVAGLAIILILYLIYKYCKWVEKVNLNLKMHKSDLNRIDYYIDNLKARVKKLEEEKGSNMDIYTFPKCINCPDKHMPGCECCPVRKDLEEQNE